MIPRLLIASSAFVFLLTACGPDAKSRIDGGVANCDQGQAQTRTLPVTVVDAMGAPVNQATITAKNLGTGLTVTAQTDADGRSAAITSAIGSGSIQVSAQKETRKTNTQQSEAVCGECGCTFAPDSVTLTLNP